LKNAQEDAARLLRNAGEDAARLLKNAQEDAARSGGATDNTLHAESHTSDERSSLKKDKLHTIGEMSSRLAHDLQNPLTIIKNTLEILKLNQPKLDKKTAENYDRIERAVAKMSQQIRDVLDYVRTSNLLMEEIPFSKLIKNVLSDLQIPGDITVILPSEDVNLFGDVKQLEVAFSNLILNSIQAIENKGKIMIQILDNGDEVAIDIIDNGRGIEKENLEHIFEPLFTTKQNGTGLGLASCKAIIENHGGNIDCSSIAGKGTVFTIKLPKTG
ncbi:sensor histidine kinase, partial [Candidatus Nitrosotenuis cloacae]|uniref:sensor histidine kinase n=1 Tax=Candidatus Nitrosotenuis cloacae TaxID=1603555 RepID=UPI0022806BD4